MTAWQRSGSRPCRSSPPCRLPVTAVCGPFQRAALNVTAPPHSYSRLLLLLSSAARGVSARLPSAAAVSSSRRSGGKPEAWVTKSNFKVAAAQRLLGYTMHAHGAVQKQQHGTAHAHPAHPCWPPVLPRVRCARPATAAAAPHQNLPRAAARVQRCAEAGLTMTGRAWFAGGAKHDKQTQQQSQQRCLAGVPQALPLPGTHPHMECSTHLDLLGLRARLGGHRHAQARHAAVG